MKRVLFAVLLSTFFINTYCSIEPGKGVSDAQLIRGDKMAGSLAHIFDASKGKFPVKFSSKGGGQTFNYDEPFLKKNYNIIGVQQLNFVQMVDDNLAAIVYDDTHIVWQLINHNGEAFGPWEHVDVKTFGTQYFCSDFAVNRERKIAYIGCFDKKSTELKPGSVAIFTYDFKSGKIVDNVIVKQTDGFRIVNRLAMFIHDFPQDSDDSDADTTFLAVYDQGHTSHKESRQVNMVRLFQGVKSGSIFHDVAVPTQIEGKTFNVVYDFYPYQSTLIVAGRLKTMETILVLAQCKLDLTDEAIVCSPNVKPTLIKSGKTIVHERGWYSELDIENKQLRLYKLHGKFTDKDWNTQLIAHMDNLVFPSGEEDAIWVRGISTSEWGGAINYGRNNHTDPGSTYLDWTSGNNNYYAGDPAAMYDRNWVVASYKDTQQQLMLLRNDAIYLVESHYLNKGDNYLSVTASDSDNSVTLNSKVIYLNSIFDRIYIKNNIGIIEINSHQTFDLKIKEEEIVWGNGINVKIESDDPKAVTGKGLTHLPVRFKFKGTDKIDGDYLFTQHTVLVKSNMGRLIWARCSRTQIYPLTYSCEEDGAHPIGNTETLQDKLIYRAGVTMAVSTNKTSSTVYLMNEHGELVTHGFNNEFIKDFNFLETPTFLYAILAFSDRVEVYAVNRNDIEEFVPYQTLDVTHTPYDAFCPIKVEIPKGSKDEFDVLSNCGNFMGNYILRWGITFNTPHMGIPLDSKIHSTDFCAFNTEYMIKGNEEVYTISNGDDFNKFNVPLDSLDASVNFDTYCLRELGQYVVLGHSHAGKNYTISVINGDQAHLQAKRYPTVVEGFEAEDIKSWDFLGQPLHVVENGQQRQFFVTLKTPLLRFSAGSVTEETDVPVKITFFNKESEQVFYQYVTVMPHD